MSVDPREAAAEAIIAKLNRPVAPQRRLDVMTIADLREPNLDNSYIVKEVIEPATVNLIFGPPGCGKTFLALDLGLSVAEGREFFGHRVNAGGVVYLATEAGRSIRNRIAGYVREYSHISDDLPFVAIPTPVDLCHLAKKPGEKDDVDLLVTTIRDAVTWPVTLLIVDTVSRALAGGDENSSEDMGAFIMALDRLRSELGCSIIGVHHVGKDTARGSRGWSGVKGAVDTEIEVTRPNEDAMISVATVTKHRDGPAGGEMGFRLKQVHLGVDDDGDPVTTCVVEPTDYVPTKKEKPKKLSERLQVILDALRRAVNEEGQPVLDTNGWNVNLRGVPIEVWRAHLLKVEERNPNFKQLWNRRRELIEIGEVIVEGELAWPKVDDDLPF